MEKIFIEQIIDKVQEKIIDYEFKYNKKPKYVRLPLWCAVEVINHNIINREHLKPKSEGKILLLNLEMCEDRNIYKIEEIEVF